MGTKKFFEKIRYFNSNICAELFDHCWLKFQLDKSNHFFTLKMTRTIAKTSSFSVSRRKSTKPKKRCNRVLQEIKYFQKSTNLLIPKLPFMRYFLFFFK